VTENEITEHLRAIGGLADADIDLPGTALLLGAVGRPAVDLAPYRCHLLRLAEEAAGMIDASDSAERQRAMLTELLAHRHSYHGDSESYDDHRNANLIDVIDRRQGLPVALAILYLHAGRSYGADIAGLNFPSHFLIRLSGRGQRLIIDPFHRGVAMDAAALRQRLKDLHGAEAEIAPEHYAAVGNRDILIRLQNNIKLRAIAAGNMARATEVIETMTLFAPDRSELSWELAVLQSRSGNLRRAIATLERFLADRPAADGRDQLEDLLHRLRGRVN
jgi:regulator of sirC expression with transglutaminase-like and TPR domain